MPAYRCRRHSPPVATHGFAAYPGNRGTRANDCRAPVFWESKVKCLVAMALLLVSASCAMAATRPPQSKAVSLEQLHSQAALIGHEVDVVSCAGIPVSDATDQQDLIVIYPCGTELSEDAIKTAVLGRLSAQTVLKPSKEWAIGDSPAFKGRFRGILKREAIDPDDKEKVLVIELGEAEFYSAVDL